VRAAAAPLGGVVTSSKRVDLYSGVPNGVVRGRARFCTPRNLIGGAVFVRDASSLNG
jgi:hypothetical protein